MKAVGKVLFPALGMLVMILDAKTAFASASDGIDQCIGVVIPSLFPFLVLAGYLNAAVSGRHLPMGRWLAQFTGIPSGSEGVLLAGLLGGYPAGAKAVADGVETGVLTKQEGERMLGFCNNAGPAFIFGMASSLFRQKWMCWALWGIHVICAVLVGHFLPEKSQRQVAFRKKAPISFPEAVRSGVATIAAVCGWVVLFRILIGFLDRWILWMLPVTGKMIVAGVLELTNGCCMLTDVESEAVRFVLCSGLLAFGGVSVAMQTASVTPGLSNRWYFPGKGLQCLFSLSLAVLICGKSLPSGALMIPAVGLAAVFFLEIRKKRGSIPQPVHV